MEGSVDLTCFGFKHRSDRTHGADPVKDGQFEFWPFGCSGPCCPPVVRREEVWSPYSVLELTSEQTFKRRTFFTDLAAREGRAVIAY